MQKKSRVNLEIIVRWCLYAMLIVTVVTAFMAFFPAKAGSEAPVGSFESKSFNEGWVMTGSGETKKVTLPYRANPANAGELTISNTLPADLSDGMSLITYSSMADMYIRIDGSIRESYASGIAGKTGQLSYYIPSAYLVVELTHEDAGKEISITILPKASANFGEVSIGFGNNVWFRIIKETFAINAIAFVVLIFGILLAIVSKIIQRISKNAGAGFFLGLFMIDFAIWLFSESSLRQLIFQRPTMVQYFAYWAIELLTPLGCVYFDAVQGKKHHKSYAFITTLSLLQILVNVVLHFTGLAELYSTLTLSHMWLAAGMIVMIVNIFRDLRSGYIRQYLVTAIGMVILLIMGIFELALFYQVRFYGIGTASCLGLLFLAAATIVQDIIDQMRLDREREEKHSQMIINTVESIAMAIDAKDEYTGGHSERVGYYAAVLAENMAESWGFSDADVQQIHYIGLLHDIGKVGVADSVLNKQGRLNDDEFSLMKKHAELGSEILAGMDMDIPGLSDSVRHHHERYDGKGYPDGLSGNEIPLVARILCLADSYDAMTSNRVYRRRLSDQDVRNEFVRCSGSQFDPEIAKVFVGLLDSGVIHPVTIQGMAANSDGKLLKSALLERRLAELTALGTRIDHPEYVRMISFLIKQDEKRNMGVDVFMLTFADEPEEDVINTIKSKLTRKDLCISCDKKMCILTLSERTADFVNEFEAFLSSLGQIRIERT